MKLLLVTHYYPAHRGGIEIVAGEVARRLAPANEITWAASDCDPVPAIEGTFRAVPMRAANFIERLAGVPFPLWGPFSCARLWREVRAADLVHIHDFAYAGNWLAFIGARVSGKPIVITQHIGLVPFASAFLRTAQRVAHATVGRWMLARADQVVFVSSVVRDYYARFVAFERPPTVIANGVDLQTFVSATLQDRRSARVLLGLDAEMPVLLFVGRFVEKKGLRILEALTKRINNVAWVFAGWGPIDPRTWNAPNVRVYENRKGAELVPLYHAADLLVLPSVGEGLPLVIQESLSCGTPVIVGDDTAAAVNGPAAVVMSCRVGTDGEQDRTVDAWEARLRQELLAVRAAPNTRAEAVAFAHATWSWASCAAQYSALFERLHER